MTCCDVRTAWRGRYKLLLEGMLKNTEADHPDRPMLQTAIEQISDVASFINDSIKRRENQAKIWGELSEFAWSVSVRSRCPPAC